MNQASIGIEIVNLDGNTQLYPKAQIVKVISVSLDIIKRHNIPATNVLAHSDIAIGRKVDPGSNFLGNFWPKAAWAPGLMMPMSPALKFCILKISQVILNYLKCLRRMDIDQKTLKLRPSSRPSKLFKDTSELLK